MTVNRQLINGELLELADKAYAAAGRPRTPILMTANDLTSLHPPLCREGRMRKFLWEPSVEERLPILQSMFPDAKLDVERLSQLADLVPAETRMSVASFAAARTRIFQRRVNIRLKSLALSEVLPALTNNAVNFDDLGAPIVFDDLVRAVPDVLAAQTVDNHLLG